MHRPPAQAPAPVSADGIRLSKMARAAQRLLYSEEDLSLGASPMRGKIEQRRHALALFATLPDTSLVGGKR